VLEYGVQSDFLSDLEAGTCANGTELVAGQFKTTKKHKRKDLIICARGDSYGNRIRYWSGGGWARMECSRIRW